MGNKRAQVTIFIIIGILIVGAGILIYTFRDNLFGDEFPVQFEPIYDNFLNCLEAESLIGIDTLESQGGYIYLPEFEPGSEYMPFSSQLDFLGNPIPYWYYVSGNNIQKEQVPSIKNMEEQLSFFIQERVRDCRFENYYLEGFEILQGEPKANVNIKGDKVEVELKMDLGISKGEDSSVVSSHKVVVNSNLGSLYDDARKIYEKEQNELFLENYGVDILRLYAPVDGVEINCAPKIWNADTVFNELREAIEANTLALKVKGGDYSLKKKENKYFIIDANVNSEVRFLNSREWANGFEVNPTNDVVMMAEPVGSQQGLGIIGFCYVPYHFVYNVRYPVLIQIYQGEELFQFPVAVVIQGNKPRDALNAEAFESVSSGVCDYKNSFVEVNTYDKNLNFVDADISYECFDDVCQLGATSSGYFSGDISQCVNGFVVARADGYKDEKKLYSSIESGSVELFMDRLYELEINLKMDGKSYEKDAIISFNSDDVSSTIVYPEQRSVKLAEGQYEIVVYVYRNSSLKIAGTTIEQCIEVPKQGVGALLGLTEEQCFNVEVPEHIVTNALSGGGKENYYIPDSELRGSSVVEISAGNLPTPSTIEQLQNNYDLFEEKELGVVFR